MSLKQVHYVLDDKGPDHTVLINKLIWIFSNQPPNNSQLPISASFLISQNALFQYLYVSKATPLLNSQFCACPFWLVWTGCTIALGKFSHQMLWFYIFFTAKYRWCSVRKWCLFCHILMHFPQFLSEKSKALNGPSLRGTSIVPNHWNVMKHLLAWHRSIYSWFQLMD